MLTVLKDLFFAYPDNNFLHHKVCTLFVGIVSASGESPHPLLQHVIKGEDDSHKLWFISLL